MSAAPADRTNATMGMALKLNVPAASSGMILRFMVLPFLSGLKIGRSV
jgi:hypothetical protein